MSKTEACRIAVLGTGSAGTRHLEVLNALPQVECIAIPRRAGRRDELKKAGYRVAENLDRAVDLGARLCIIASDTGKHVEDGIAAIERGLSVLVEKPLGSDLNQAKRLARHAEQHDQRLFVGCVLRFSESLSTFRRMIAQIGRLHAVTIECRSYLPDWRPARPYQDSYSARADEGGVLRDLVHEIDYAGWLFGWPAAVQARVRNLQRLGIDADELAELSWETSGGCVVSVSLDYLTRPARRKTTAFGEFGTLEWDAIEDTVSLTLPASPRQVVQSSQTRSAMFSVQDEAFIGTIRNGVDSRLATGQDGLRALAVCDAARRAAVDNKEQVVESA